MASWRFRSRWCTGCGGGSDRVTIGHKNRDLGAFIIGVPGDADASVVHSDLGMADLAASGTSSGRGSVTYAGSCSGSVVTWCEQNMVQTYDCAQDGVTCSVVMGDADCR